MKKILQNNFPLLLILMFAAVLFFYNHSGSLQPWDEAWYAAIAKNMLASKNPWVLEFNGAYFYDHPPLGFQIKTLNLWLFGPSTLTLRLSEIFSGFIALIALYKTGEKISSKWAGAWAALLLLTTRWFLFRARLGNLDILLLASQLMTIWMFFEMLKTQKRTSPHPHILSFLYLHKWVFLMWFFFGLSMLSKALISLQLLPLLILGTLFHIYTQKITFTQYLLLVVGSCLSVAIPVAPWIMANNAVDANRFLQTQKTIGFRSNTEKSITLEFILTTISYTQAAAHRWFKVMALSGVVSFYFFWLKKYRNIYFFLLLYVGLEFGPYLISEKTEIWHLIPGIGALSLLSGVTLSLLPGYITAYLYPPIAKYVPLQKNHFKRLLFVGSTVLILFVSILNIRDYWTEFISVHHFPSDYEKITWHIPYKNQPLYTTLDAYFPGLVYYSSLEDQSVHYLSDSDDKRTCKALEETGVPLQIVSQYGDWVMDRMQDSYLVAREGNLVLSVLEPEDCAFYLENQR